ncbi:MAG: CHASE domain-containing protein [Pontibacterium sp.]
MSERRNLISLFVLIGGAILTLLTWMMVIESEHRQAKVDFENKTSPIMIAIERRVAANIEVVRSISSFYRGSAQVSRSDFKAFTWNALSYYPGIAALEWLPRVPAAERKAYEKAAIADGLENFQILDLSDKGLVPAARRAEYYPVYYAEPLASNQKALGFDLASNPERLAALEQARDTNRAVATPRINLVQGTDKQAAFLLFVPVYENGHTAATKPERQKALKGFALGVFTLRGLIETALSQEGLTMKGINLDLFDLDAPDSQQLLYSSHEYGHTQQAAETQKAFNLAHNFQVGGRNWLLVTHPKNLSTGIYQKLSSWIVLLLGGALTILLSLYLRNLADKASLVERQAKRQADQLRHSEAFNTAILDTVVDGILTINPQGIVQSCNPATARMFGFSHEEVIGQNIKMLMPNRYAKAHDGYLHHYMTTGEARVIGIGREVEGQRKNGEIFPLELAVSKMEVDGQVFFAGVVRDATERTKVDKMKAEFISTVSHELRTPLTSIRGAMGLVSGGAAGELPPQAKKLVDIAASNSERLVRLINDILDIEKIESGKMLFELSRKPLVALVEQAIEENKAYAEQHQSRFILSAEAHPLIVNIDTDRMRQVLDNLLSNAAKYGAEKDDIEISVHLIGQLVEVRVTDHGQGIPEDFRDQIFNKFAQADSSDTRQKGGTGLGLNIAKAIVEHHQGRLWFETEEGVGTSFIFQLPVVEQPAPPITDADSRVLICEDNEDIGMLLKMMLEKEQIKADLAPSAEEALTMLDQHEYQLLTLDLKLSGRDGISLLHELRASDKHAQLPVVVVSGSDRSDTVNALQIADWICKPIDEKRLLKAVEQAVKKVPDRGLARILHVEDDRDVATVTGAMLHEFSEVELATELSDARLKLQHNTYDLVILDVGLPDGSGLDLLPQLTEQTPSTPVIVFSAQEISVESAHQVAGVLVKSRAGNTAMVEMVKRLLNRPEGEDA